jgi:hypothetical protein
MLRMRNVSIHILGGKISADVTWDRKYEKGDEKEKKMKEREIKRKEKERTRKRQRVKLNR